MALGDGGGVPLGDGTRAVHAGLPEPRKNEPLLPGPTFASLYHLPGEPSGPFTYGRYANPTWARYEAAIGEENQKKIGDLLNAHEQLAPRGVTLREVPAGPGFIDAVDGASLVWIESPSNPRLEVCDIAETCRRAHAAGALVAVDNTLATPLGQRPLELGADFSMSSDTKYVTGHSDLLLGHVAARDESLAKRLLDWRSTTGAVPGPFETWLAHRSLATLDVRLERQCATALALALMLGARVGEGFVRMSVGCETEADLLADVARALDASAG